MRRKAMIFSERKRRKTEGPEKGKREKEGGSPPLIEAEASWLLLSESISHAAQGLNRIPERAKFFSQAADVGVYRPRIAFVGVSPDFIEKPFPGLNAPSPGGKFEKELKLGEGQLDRFLLNEDLMAIHIDQKISDLKGFIRILRYLLPAKDGLYP
jgi:hypothetical protein